MHDISVYLQTGEIGQERERILLDLTNEIGAQVPAEKGWGSSAGIPHVTTRIMSCMHACMRMQIHLLCTNLTAYESPAKNMNSAQSVRGEVLDHRS
jgi:hypothetical protein